MKALLRLPFCSDAYLQGKSAEACGVIAQALRANTLNPLCRLRYHSTRAACKHEQVHFWQTVDCVLSPPTFLPAPQGIQGSGSVL